MTEQYCKSCDGSGTIPTGIAEASESSCLACEGTGYARATPADLTQRVDHIDQQGYAHWKISNDTKGPRSIDDATGRDRSVPGTCAKDDPQLSPGQCVIEEAIGKLHIATLQLTDPRRVPGLILEAIDKLNWISANPESFSATPADQDRLGGDRK